MRSRRLRSIVLAGCALAGFAANSSAQFVASWTSATSGTWTNAANWSTNPAFPNNNSPAVGDTYDAVINAIGPAYTVTLDLPITLNSLHLNSPSATLLQNGGTLTLVNGGTLSSGTHQFSQNSVLAGPGSYNIRGGMFRVQGTSGTRQLMTTLNNQGLIYLAQSGLTLNNGTINNQAGATAYLAGGGINQSLFSANLFSNQGTIYGDQGGMSVPMSNSGTLQAFSSFSLGTAAYSHEIGSRLIGPGFFSLTGGTHTINGQLDLEATTSLQDAVITGPGTFNLSSTLTWNSGTISGSGPMNILPNGKLYSQFAAVRTLARSINNQGEIHLNNSPTTLGGQITITNSGLLRFTTPSGIFSGSGVTVINSGTMMFDGTASANFGYATVNSGTILSNGRGLNLFNVTHNENSFIGGTATIAFTGLHTINGTLSLPASGVSFGSISGPGMLRITGASTWNSSTTMGGTGVTNISAGANLVGSGTLLRTLNNAGTLSIPLNASPDITVAGGTLNNLAGGVIVAFSRLSNPSGAVTNSGTIIFANTTVSSSGAPSINNSGTIIAHRAATLGGSTHNTGAYLGGTSPITISGAQNVLGSLTIAGSVSNSATLTGAGAVDVFGTLNLATGFVQGPGAINVKPGGTLNVGTPSLSRIVNNAGVASLNASNSTFTGTFNNGTTGLMYLGAASFSLGTYSLPIRNNGTLIANAQNGAGIQLNTTGSLSLFNAGTIIVPTGSLSLRGTFLSGSHIAGDGTTTFTSLVHEGDITLAGSNTLLNGQVLGYGEMNVTGTLHWNSGTIGNFSSTGTLNIMPGAVLDTPLLTVSLERNLNNHGIIKLGATIDDTNFAPRKLKNFETGLIEIPNLSFSNFEIENHGTMIYRREIVSSGFENFGTLIFQGSISGTRDISFRNGSTLAGTGTLNLFSNTMVTEGTVTLAHDQILSNSLSFAGSGDLIITGFLSGGTILGTGAVRVMDGGRYFVGSISRDLFIEPGGLVESSFGTFADVANRGLLNIFGSATISGGAQHNNLSDGLIRIGRLNGGSSSLLANAGTVENVGTNSMIIAPFSNTGTMSVLAGTTSINGGVAQLTGTTLTAGKWIVGFDAQLNINNGTITTNQAEITLNGPLSRFPALNSLAANQGTFSLRLGRSFTAAGSFTNSGVINIDNGGALFVNDALFNSGTINGLVIQTGSSTLSGNSYIKTLRGGDVFVETSAAARVDYLDAAALSIASQADLTLGAGSIAHVIDILNIAPADGTLSAGRLDLLSGRLVIDYTGSSPADAVAQLLATGFNNGDWLGRGITSSSILTGSNFAIGMIESAEIFSMGGTFAGVNVDNTALLLDRTLKGDANLDYTVNISDFAIVAANFNSPTKWSKGDFNYDGTTNIADFALLAANFNLSLPSALPRSIPEPVTFAGAILVALVQSRRR